MIAQSLGAHSSKINLTDRTDAGMTDPRSFQSRGKRVHRREVWDARGVEASRTEQDVCRQSGALFPVAGLAGLDELPGSRPRICPDNRGAGPGRQLVERAVAPIRPRSREPAQQPGIKARVKDG
jgi:hypothetical protein